MKQFCAGEEKKSVSAAVYNILENIKLQQK
jgi:hypothetical protein